MLYDDGEPLGEPCPHCGSTHTNFSNDFHGGFWKCEECSCLFQEKEYRDAITALTKVAQDYLKQLNDGTRTAKTVQISGIDFEV